MEPTLSVSLSVFSSTKFVVFDLKRICSRRKPIEEEKLHRVTGFRIEIFVINREQS
jgi:hypothetical protein